MVRTQIQLTEEQAAKLKLCAQESHESLAAIVRKALDQFLATQQPDRGAKYRRAWTVIGKYQAGAPDISSQHDRYLEEEFGA